MIIGITGSVGSGKSIALKVFEDCGYSTISMDSLNRGLISQKDYIAKVAELFPNCVTNNKIDTKMLSKEIFSSKEKRVKLNKIAHKSLEEMMSGMIDAYREFNDDLVIEVPLLVECNLDHYFDSIWLITSDKQSCLKRVTERDNRSIKEAEQIYNSQTTDEERAKFASVIIHNDGNLDDYIAELKIRIIGILGKKD